MLQTTIAIAGVLLPASIGDGDEYCRVVVSGVQKRHRYRRRCSMTTMLRTRTRPLKMSTRRTRETKKDDDDVRVVGSFVDEVVVPDVVATLGVPSAAADVVVVVATS